MPRKRTGAERYFDERLTDPEYRAHYEAARRRINKDRGQELEDVLELAEMFPARHSQTLDAPVFGR